jgi:hypothetical protein
VRLRGLCAGKTWDSRSAGCTPGISGWLALDLSVAHGVVLSCWQQGLTTTELQGHHSGLPGCVTSQDSHNRVSDQHIGELCHPHSADRSLKVRRLQPARLLVPGPSACASSVLCGCGNRAPVSTWHLPVSLCPNAPFVRFWS